MSDHQQLLSEHRLSLAGLLARHRLHVTIGGICLAVGVSIVLWSDEETSLWVGAITTGLSLFWGVPPLITYIRSIKQVLLFDEGIAWTVRRRGEYLPWEELREVYRREKVYSIFSRQTELVLVFRKKQEVTFEQTLSDFFVLVTLVEAVTLERLLPLYRKAIDEGDVQFGPIRLRREGVRIYDQDFTWEELAYDIRDGGIVISSTHHEDYAGEFASFAEMPNYLVLLRLLEERGKKPISPTSS